MEKQRRQEVLKRGKPERLYPAEPGHGGWHSEEDIEAVVDVMRKAMDWHVGFLTFSKQQRPEIFEFEEAFANYCGTQHCGVINGAGTGLDLAMMFLDLEPGDEVIVPAINFVAAPLSVAGQGGQVVWCEVDPRTFQADPEDVERRITSRTRAIYPVHMNGLSAPMDDLLDVAERNPHPKYGPLKVIGDAARSCGGEYKGTKIGKKGWITVHSFHSMKLMTTLGEGGAITTDDPEVYERLVAYRQFGWGRTWGTNYKLTCVQAAMGLVQLRHLDERIALRRKRALERNEMLADVPELTLPYEPPDCMHTYYLDTCLVPEGWAGEKRDLLLKVLAEEFNVGAGPFNRPAYESNAFLAQHTRGQRLPVSDELGRRLVAVSLHPLMTEEENEYIAAAVSEAVERVKGA
jgi:dTDP-4-amino-4,6-dideoxygalactose transaminase